MKAGNYAEACPKLEASNRLDPGFGTEVNLGDCYEKLGKVASAWASYSEAVDIARKDGQASRVIMAQKRLEGVTSRLSRVKLTLAAGADVPGLTISRDGQRMDRALVGSATPVDPGEYTIVASASGYKPWETKIKVTEGQTTNVEIGTLEKNPIPDKLPDTPPDHPPIVPDTTITVKAVPPDPGRTRRIAGLTVGIAGVVALGVGAYFGISAFSQWSDAGKNCVGSVCNPAGIDAANNANSSATMSDIFIGGGAALLIAGTILYVTAPHAAAPEAEAAEKATSWRVAPGGAGSVLGVTLGRRF